MAPMMPMSMPDATMAGMMGTKTSERTLMARWRALPLLAAASFASSLDAADTPDWAMKASKTLLTVPVP